MEDHPNSGLVADPSTFWKIIVFYSQHLILKGTLSKTEHYPKQVDQDGVRSTSCVLRDVTEHMGNPQHAEGPM